jgi:hypothetical protein
VTDEEMAARWESMRNDIERQLDILRSRATKEGATASVEQMINDLTSLREKLESLLVHHRTKKHSEQP